MILKKSLINNYVLPYLMVYSHWVEPGLGKWFNLTGWNRDWENGLISLAGTGAGTG